MNSVFVSLKKRLTSSMTTSTLYVLTIRRVECKHKTSRESEELPMDHTKIKGLNPKHETRKGK